MNEQFLSGHQLEPTADQQEVLNVLRSTENDEYPLGDWYLGVLYAMWNRHNPDWVSQAAQSLREVLEKLPRVVHSIDTPVHPYNFQRMRQVIYSRWINDRERYNQIWKDKVIDNKLDKTLRKIDQYLELNQRPTRRKQVQSAIGQIDPMANVLGPGIQEEKQDRFHKLWEEIQGFAHHKTNPDEQRFVECFSAIERTILDLLAPITAQNQQDIRRILGISEPTEPDIDSMSELISRRGANYAFFFQEVKSAIWVPILEERGFFSKPPGVERVEEGQATFPFWPPVLYLKRVVNFSPEKVVGILVKIQETDNPHILHELCETVCRLGNSALSLKLLPGILKFIESPYQGFQYVVISKLLQQWSKGPEDLLDGALKVLENAISFKADQDFEDKQAERKENPDHWASNLNPLPRFDHWDYQQILEHGVRPLTEKAAYQVAVVLTNVTASMLRLSMYPEDIEAGNHEDSSEIWCRRLDRTDPIHQSSKVDLIHALTFACEKVYENSPESVVESLDETLRNHRWSVFNRLRQHLYALHPNEQTLPWIREFILVYQDYAKRGYSFEFQRMVREAGEYFGDNLLDKEERKIIFDSILSGPSKDGYRGFVGSGFTEEGFQEYQRRFHFKQLRPFASLLTGAYKSHFHELENEFKEDPLSDEDYHPVGEMTSGAVSYRSPRTLEELAALGDEDLLAYINGWQDAHYDENNWLVEINIRALADAFQKVFKESIIRDEERLAFWMNRDNAGRIERPIYVKAIIQAIQAHVKEQHFEQVNLWFGFCEWVLLHTNVEYTKGVNIDDESREHPDWRSSRRAVHDFVVACLEKDLKVPLSAREPLAGLLELLCTQFEKRLDCNEAAFPGRNNQLMEAINITRSNALKTLVRFGFWLRDHEVEDTTTEIAYILESRLKADAARPLAMPERAMLGMNFGNLVVLNKAWATKHRSAFFPQDDLSVWTESFGNFLRFNHPSDHAFEILEGDYVFALNHLTDLKGMENNQVDAVNRLGQHLFIYYLWQVYSLKGEDGSLLEKFYKRTSNNRKQWGRLFDHVGHFLRDSGDVLDEGLEKRITTFFDWRLDVGEPQELGEFTMWLLAKCLDPGWRLEAYSRTLDAGVKIRDVSITIALDVLNDMLGSHTAKVVECFAKMIDIIEGESILWVQTEKANSILAAGMSGQDEGMRENAERAREKLLKHGRFDILDPA